MEIYNARYAPSGHENIVAEYNSSDEDLVFHILQKQKTNLNLNELKLFLNVKRAGALDDILKWWKVNLILNLMLKFSDFCQIN